MNHTESKIEADRRMLEEAKSQGLGGKFATFAKLSGPGWLQSAITLGGGSLASSLFLGILGGYTLLWVQPLAMILGIIMLSAIGYVTLSTGQRPFHAIRDHVNPVLAWGWALAVAAANIVWCLPQYSLAFGVVSQNLLPGLFGQEGTVTQAGGDNGSYLSMAIVSSTLLIICTIITWSYDRGGWGIKLYETVLKVLVALIVLCFIGVVTVLTVNGAIDWGAVTQGIIPNFGQFWKPAASFEPMLANLDESAREYWSKLIVSKQQDVMFSAAATAVGINMTFLFPYSLLSKGWTREFRGLSIFDLSTGMFIPYVIATGCVVIAASAQFHTKVTDDFQVVGNKLVAPADLAGAYQGTLEQRMLANNDYARKQLQGTPANAVPALKAQMMAAFLAETSMSEQEIAAALVNRKAKHLSGALAPLTGKFVADIVFGLGVLAMALSTISLLMLISGFVFCEMFGFEPGSWFHRFGTLVAGVIGAFGPYIWSGASFYLAIPTSVFGLALLPFAYITFFLLMNQKSLLGDDMPRGGARVVWNLLMLVAAVTATAASLYVVYTKTLNGFGSGWYGLGGIGLLLGLILVVQFTRKPKHIPE
ncbi:MAG: divalent metal cation transporter [Pirellulaceae bacterium]|nr:divalent metal cation transporter [Pirellulaceae bacterium]